jgi:hypothetical protein
MPNGVLAALSVLALLVVSACDRRPMVADSTAALSPPGTEIPTFDFPAIRPHWNFDRSRLNLGHTLVALVPPNATGRELALVEFDSLERRFPMFRFAVVYNRPLEKRDTAYLNPPSWLQGVERGFANDSLIIATFGAGLRDSSDRDRRPVYALPSFLVISDKGRVLGRAAGSPAPLRRVLDSLKFAWDSTRTAEGDAEVAKARPAIERGVQSFDPVTLAAPGVPFTLAGTCGGEETVSSARIPAAGRLLRLDARHPGLTAIVELVTVADVFPIDEDDVCRSDSVRIVPTLRTTVYRMSFFGDPGAADSTLRSPYGLDMSVEVYSDSAGSTPSFSLFGLDTADRKFALEAGVTIEALRARIDSIRAARR